MKAQSASLHFFLGSDEESEDSEESDDDVGSCLTNKIPSSPHLYQTINVKSLEHKRAVKKKTRSGNKKMRKMLKTASKVWPFSLVVCLI